MFIMFLITQMSMTNYYESEKNTPESEVAQNILMRIKRYVRNADDLDATPQVNNMDRITIKN